MSTWAFLSIWSACLAAAGVVADRVFLHFTGRYLWGGPVK